MVLKLNKPLPLLYNFTLNKFHKITNSKHENIENILRFHTLSIYIYPRNLKYSKFFLDLGKVSILRKLYLTVIIIIIIIIIINVILSLGYSRINLLLPIFLHACINLALPPFRKEGAATPDYACISPSHVEWKT